MRVFAIVVVFYRQPVEMTGIIGPRDWWYGRVDCGCWTWLVILQKLKKEDLVYLGFLARFGQVVFTNK